MQKIAKETIFCLPSPPPLVKVLRVLKVLKVLKVGGEGGSGSGEICLFPAFP